MSDRSTSEKKDHSFPSTAIKRDRSRGPDVDTDAGDKYFPTYKGGEMKYKSTCLPVSKG